MMHRISNIKQASMFNSAMEASMPSIVAAIPAVVGNWKASDESGNMNPLRAMIATGAGGLGGAVSGLMLGGGLSHATGLRSGGAAAKLIHMLMGGAGAGMGAYMGRKALDANLASPIDIKKSAFHNELFGV